MMVLAIVLLTALCLAYANGANDNFKGVATLFGSGTANYRGALAWATLTTFLGSLTAVFLAEQLLKSFSGRGLVDKSLTSDPRYLAAVALGAGLTVLLATRVGMPVSTTHALVGALVGAGWAAGSMINFANLGAQFFLPLLTAPVVALAVTMVCYVLFHQARTRLGVLEQTCFCVGHETVDVVPCLSPAVSLQRIEQLTVTLGNEVTCHNRYHGAVLGIQASLVLDWLHYLSAGIVSFARGLNDTPKIAALLLVLPGLRGWGGLVLVALFMAAGGILSARKVAETLSGKITSMNHGQGFTANLVTGAIVILASTFQVPVSTTHVSCGAMFGLGTITGQAHWGMIRKILAAWVTTLPAGAVLGAAAQGCIQLLAV